MKNYPGCKELVRILSMAAQAIPFTFTHQSSEAISPASLSELTHQRFYPSRSQARPATRQQNKNHSPFHHLPCQNSPRYRRDRVPQRHDSSSV